MSDSPSLPPPPAPLPAVQPPALTNLPGPKNGSSRESSEFEFLDGTKPPQPASSAAATQKDQQPPAVVPVVAAEALPVSPGDQLQKRDDGGDKGNDPGLFGWVRGASGGLFSKVAEKTKTSMETVITTLDPQMKDFMHSGGDITVAVASSEELAVVAPARHAFQAAFGRATVYGVPTEPLQTVAAQPVGFAAARQAAAERLQHLKKKRSMLQTSGTLEEAAVLLAVENFLLETGEDAWVSMGCLSLTDAAREISLTAYTQPIPVSTTLVTRAKDATPESYPRRWSGLAQTVAEAAKEEENHWHETATAGGASRADMVLLAARMLAAMYRRELASRKQQQI